jgi:redox-sensitive bicupin YhaK (pirin superfamily)
MSGPVTTSDAAAVSDHPGARPPCVEIIESRSAAVGRFAVRRALPRRARRNVGPWCFADHLGPAGVTENSGLDIGPHPHIGLQTVTWLIDGEVLHRDSLGSEQVIRPGQLNLMTAGAGVSHSEEATGAYRGDLHGIQFWVAQPAATRDAPPAFEHHGELPRAELPGCIATALVGNVAGMSSPARRDTDHMGAELEIHASATIPLDAAFEHAVVVLTGALTIDGTVVTPGHLAYLGKGRDELHLQPNEVTRAALIGGADFTEPLLMWWNFVARTEDEITEAYLGWTARSERFGSVASPLAAMDTEPPPWGPRLEGAS